MFNKAIRSLDEILTRSPACDWYVICVNIVRLETSTNVWECEEKPNAKVKGMNGLNERPNRLEAKRACSSRIPNAFHFNADPNISKHFTCSVAFHNISCHHISPSSYQELSGAFVSSHDVSCALRNSQVLSWLRSFRWLRSSRELTGALKSFQVLS